MPGDDGRQLPDRRAFLALGAGAFAVMALPAPFRSRNRLVRRSVPAMGTVAELAVVHRSESHAHRALDAAVLELRRVEGLMTRFRDDSDVGRANLAAAGAPVAVSTETARVLGEALDWARLSDGVFDPTLGRAVRLWDVEHRSVPPGPVELERVRRPGLWRRLEVETSGSAPRVRFHDPAVSLDLGGIAKGYGVDAAARALVDHGVFHGLVNVGGDIRALGHSDDGDDWEIGVRSPEDPRRLATTLRLADGAVATSGDYLRYFEHGGRRYHHLLDPETGLPRRSRTRTLTIEATTCMTADAAATTVFGMSRRRSERLLTGGRGDARIVHMG